LEILRDADVISRSQSKGFGKKPKHIIFVDDEEEGARRILDLSMEGLTLF
jgi:hypothetical protein